MSGETPPEKSAKSDDSEAQVMEESKGTDLQNCSEEDETASPPNAPKQINAMTDEEIAQQLQESYDKELSSQDKNKATAKSENTIDKDEAYAQQLQSTYDREHSVLSHVEKFSAKRNNTNKQNHKKGSSKRSKIDFFLKK